MSSADSEGVDQNLPSSSQGAQIALNGVVPVFARAKHSFEGRNNDELSFRKGEVITVTQQLEGGWWEGTLSGSTGWFPSDYVVVIPESERFLRTRTNGVFINGPSTITSAENPKFASDDSRQTYHQEVMRGFLDRELAYVDAITKFYNDVLLKMKLEKMTSNADFDVLADNLQLLVAQQRETFDAVREAVEKSAHHARVGGILLRAAPTLRQLLRFYCENHPKAVDLILRKREEYEKMTAKLGCDLKELISGLSRPFRHLELYPSALNELERCMSEAHPDRGDTQRAASVFRDIANYCALIRKQKEMQLELISSGLIEGLPQAELIELGDVLYMGNLSIGDEDAVIEEQLPVDRCVVLFSSSLIVLEITAQMNAYVLRQKILTAGQTLKKLESKPTLILCNAEGCIELTMNISSNEEMQRWIENFALCPELIIDDSCSAAIIPAAPQKIQVGTLRNMTELSPLRKAEVSQLPAALKANNARKISISAGLRFDHDLEMILPETGDEKEQIKNGSSKPTKLYSGYCLRPYPVTRANYAVDYSKKANVKMRKGPSQTDQEDAFLLRIIEGYCGSSRANKQLGGQQAYHTHGYQPPQLIVAEDEKIFVEEMVGDEVVVRERSLVDTVYALKDQISAMQKEIRHLSSVIDREQKARRRLEELVRRYSNQYSTSSTPKPAADVTDSEQSALP